MAVSETGAIFKGFVFDGVDSKAYGVYISGDAVYNAPERDVEMIEIPGRNGAFVLDKGRFANITVTYPAGMFGDTEDDFAEGISDLRNALASRKGYCVLTDDYNPNEYRLAVYRSGLEVDPASLEAGEFNIVFDCKPQRFLTSGETAQSIANNGSISNPTLFESSPILSVEGYGVITIDNKDIEVHNEPIGTVLLKNRQNNANYITNINTASFKTGDEITIDYLAFYLRHVDTVAITDNQTSYGAGLDVTGLDSSAKSVYWLIEWTTIPTLHKGTTLSQVWTFDSMVEDSTGNYQYQYEFTLAYDGANEIQFTIQRTAYTHTGTNRVYTEFSRDVGNIYGESTMPVLGNPIYIDLDIGEAYKIVGSDIVSVNSGVSLPAELPTLKPGTNTITYDNTITSFKVTPRWWIV